MRVAAPMREEEYMARRSTPTPSKVDGYLDDLGEQHTELELALGRIDGLVAETVDARKAAIIITANLKTGENEGQIGRLVEEWSRMSAALYEISQAVHVSRASVDQARVAALELRAAPAIRRARQEVRRGNEERRTRERRQGRQWNPREVAA